MEAVLLSEGIEYPYYNLDDQGNIKDLVFFHDYEPKPATHQNIYFTYYDGNYEFEYFKCKVCYGTFSFKGHLHYLKQTASKYKDFRIHLLKDRICRKCSGKLAKKKGYQTIKNRWKTQEYRDNFSKKMSGPNHPHWKGGIKFEPYCYLFNEKFKERVREFWNRQCGLCGKSEEENGVKLSVHHVDYDKKSCCDTDTFNSTPNLFIPLCSSHHSMTNHNRDYWEDMLSNFIMLYFDGKSFLEK